MKKRFSQKTVDRLFNPKPKQVSRDSFILARPDSHMVEEPVKGYTVTYGDIHFLLERALIRFPSLMITECKHCRDLKKKIESGDKVDGKLSTDMHI